MESHGSVSQWLLMEEILDQFEADWQSGRAPTIEQVLQQQPHRVRRPLLGELIRLEAIYRHQAGEHPQIAEYAARFPELDGDALASLVESSARSEPVGLSTRFVKGIPSTVNQRETSEQPLAAFAHYSVCGRVGRGGMGVVYRLYDQHLQRELAVKILQGRFRDHEEAVARFLFEARIAAQLQHPGIVPVHELGRLPDGRPYFTMKLVAGCTLDTLLEARRHPGEALPQWLGVFEQVAQAVGYAHRQGVIHRDLKPANVMVGGFGEVQVMDWGLAKRLDRPGSAAPSDPAAGSTDAPLAEESRGERTYAGAVLGTLAYMPPEQARGDLAAVDSRSDVFGLGGILCQILTGGPVYCREAESVQWQAQEALVGDAFARLDRCGAAPELIALAKACLAPEPADRPQDAAAVAAAVAAYQDGVQTRLEHERLERGKAQARQRSRLRWGAGFVLVLLAGMAGTLWERWIAEERLEQREQAVGVLAGIFVDLDAHAQDRPDRPLRALLAERLVEAAEQLDRRPLSEPRMMSRLQDRLGLALLHLGYPHKAIGVLNQAYGARQAGYPTGTPETLQSLNNLADAYRAAGDWARARELYQQGLALRKRYRGPHHPATLNSMNNLAVALKDDGQLGPALELFEQTLALRQTHLGKTHPDTLMSMNNLADGYRVMRQLHRALPLFEQALALRRQVLGPHHPHTLTSMNNLGVAYRADGQLDRALGLFEQTLTLRKAHLGSDHPETLTSMNNLGAAYWSAKRLDRSVPLLEETLRRRDRKLGRDHPDTQFTVANLGVNYKDAGRTAEALPLLEEAYWASNRYARLHWVGGQLLLGYLKAGKRQATLRLLEQQRTALAIRPPSASTRWAGILAQQGLSRLQSSVWAEAESLLRESLRLRRQQQPNAWTTFNAMAMLGGALLGQQRYAEAEPLLLEGYRGMHQRLEAIPQVGRPRLLEAASRLIELYAALVRPEEVTRWRVAKQTFQDQQPCE